MEPRRVLFAWEMGANYGHASKMLPVARALRNILPDTQIWFAVRDPLAIMQMTDDPLLRLLPAPFAPARVLGKGEHPAQSYSGALACEGWDQADRLGALVQAWDGLIDLVAPDLVVAQAAPTVILALKGKGIPVAVLGSGYDNPPLASPMPAFEPEKPELVAIALAQEQVALAAALEVLAARGVPEPPSICDILRPDLSLLATIPEVDSYAPRAAIEPNHPPYLGQILNVSTGFEVAWRSQRRGARIFAYLRPGSRPAAAALGALWALGEEHDILIAAPGISAGEAARLRAREVQVVDGPVRLDRLLPECNLGISHAGNGTAAAFLSYGVPQLCLPTQSEQALCARAISRAGIGRPLSGHFGSAAVVDLVRRMLEDTELLSRVNLRRQTLPSDIDEAAEKKCGNAILYLLSIS